jgi:hypothetical protein
MKKLFLLIGLLYPLFVSASPFIVSDDTAQDVTHCGVFIDSDPKIDIPVTDTKSCKYDINYVSVGAHTIKFTYVKIDPIWGRSESVESAPFTFTRPSQTIEVSPSGLLIAP